MPARRLEHPTNLVQIPRGILPILAVCLERLLVRHLRGVVLLQVRIWYCDWLACVSVEVCLVIVDILVVVSLAVVVIVGVVVVVLMIVIMVMMVMPMPMPVPVPMVVVLVVDDLLAVARPGLMVALDIMTVAVAVPAFFLIRILLVHW